MQQFNLPGEFWRCLLAGPNGPAALTSSIGDGGGILVQVVHTVGSLRADAGGPSRTVTALCSALGRFGAGVQLVSQAGSSRAADGDIIPFPELVTTALVARGPQPWGRNVWSGAFQKTLESLCRQNNLSLMHDHGLWLPSNHAAAVVSRRLGIARVVSPRGMLEPWALEHRAWKKRLAWHLYQERDLADARLFHATAEPEADNIRKLGLRQPITVIPNGVDLPSAVVQQTRGSEHRSALFLSRIHPVKGLVNLIAAWALVRPPGWRLLIAGPDEAGHRAEVEARIQAARLNDSCELVGPVDGKSKAALYRSADLFILPSFTENFGVVVAEALAHGVPVITTRGTPWSDLEAFGCGWWVEIGVPPLAEALRAATAVTDAERAAMGERGRAYVQRYNWDAIAAEMLAVYRWVLGQGERPASVRLD